MTDQPRIVTPQEAAVRRIQESRDSHVRWIAHLKACDFCAEYPPEHVQTVAEHEQIVAEYDGVLIVLNEAATEPKRRDEYARAAVEEATDE